MNTLDTKPDIWCGPSTKRFGGGCFKINKLGRVVLGAERTPHKKNVRTSVWCLNGPMDLKGREAIGGSPCTLLCRAHCCSAHMFASLSFSQPESCLRESEMADGGRREEGSGGWKWKKGWSPSSSPSSRGSSPSLHTKCPEISQSCIFM